jgi:hypothetical protein
MKTSSAVKKQFKTPEALEDGFRGPEQSDVEFDDDEEDAGEDEDEDYALGLEGEVLGTPSGKQLRKARGLSGSGKTGDRDLRGTQDL